MSNPIIQKIKESSTKFEPKKPSLREHLNSIYPHISAKINIKNDKIIKEFLTIRELTEAMKYLNYKVEKNTRNLKTRITKDNKKNRISDDLEASLFADVEQSLATNGLKFCRTSWDDAIKTMRNDNQYCPVKEQLEALEWDRVKRLNKGFLSKYFSDKDGVISEYLRAFLVGAVGRVYNSSFQSPVLILAGEQGKGKSYFCKWLAEPFGDDLYAEKAIDPDNKDDFAVCCQKLIIEIPETGKTFKKDREALKRHFTTSNFEYRPPYGKYSIQHAHLASYIATLNLNNHEIFKDSTGNRRYIVCEIENINKAYSKDIDAMQLWLEAKEIYDKRKKELGTSYEALIDVAKRDQINSKYQSESLEWSYFDEMLEFTDNDYDRLKITNIKEKYILVSNDRNIKQSVFRSLLQEWLYTKYKISPVKMKINNISTKGVKYFKFRT